MKILFHNKAKDSGVKITNQKPNINYPCENLIHSFLELDYRAESTTDQADIEFSETITANSIFWGFHKVSSIVFRLYDIKEKVLWEQVVHNPSQNGALFFDDILGIKELKMVLTAASGQAGIVFGGIAIGDSYTMPDPLNTWGFGFEDNSFTSGTPAGQLLVNKIRPLRSREYAFRGVPLDKTKEIVLLYQENIGNHIWVDAFEDTNAITQPVYCTIEEFVPPVKEPDAEGHQFTFNLTLKEAR